MHVNLYIYAHININICMCISSIGPRALAYVLPPKDALRRGRPGSHSWLGAMLANMGDARQAQGLGHRPILTLILILLLMLMAIVMVTVMRIVL